MQNHKGIQSKKNVMTRRKRSRASTSGSYLFFDLETTGLPAKTHWSRDDSYKNLDRYDDCRVVTVAWLITNESLEVISEHYHVIQPDGFVIPQDSVLVHGITMDEAVLKGEPICTVLEKMALMILDADHIVSHNLNFDINVLRSEMYRMIKNPNDVISSQTKEQFSMVLAQLDTVDCKELHCTMLQGKEFMKEQRFPTLKRLYEYLFPGMILEGAHNALEDTRNCFACFERMYNMSGFMCEPTTTCTATM